MTESDFKLELWRAFRELQSRETRKTGHDPQAANEAINKMTNVELIDALTDSS